MKWKIFSQLKFNYIRASDSAGSEMKKNKKISMHNFYIVKSSDDLKHLQIWCALKILELKMKFQLSENTKCRASSSMFLLSRDFFVRSRISDAFFLLELSYVFLEGIRQRIIGKNNVPSVSKIEIRKQIFNLLALELKSKTLLV